MDPMPRGLGTGPVLGGAGVSLCPDTRGMGTRPPLDSAGGERRNRPSAPRGTRPLSSSHVPRLPLSPRSANRCVAWQAYQIEASRLAGAQRTTPLRSIWYLIPCGVRHGPTAHAHTCSYEARRHACSSEAHPHECSCGTHAHAFSWLDVVPLPPLSLIAPVYISTRQCHRSIGLDTWGHFVEHEPPVATQGMTCLREATCSSTCAVCDLWGEAC